MHKHMCRLKTGGSKATAGEGNPVDQLGFINEFEGRGDSKGSFFLIACVNMVVVPSYDPPKKIR